ncbi:MAG: hypothetical protein JWM68_3743 [Verrucomicrobiales bacterium]|nr:hypothetical protein [Verrucomicrobiales bacterium]
MKQIIIEVSEDGGITIAAVGFKGTSCEQATAAMEKALGVKSKSKKMPEYYQENKTQGLQST